MKTFKATIAGPALIMHNGRLANPLDPYTKALKEATSKKKKGDDDHAEIARREFQGGLYHDEELGPFLPGEMLSGMLVEGARKSKLGREFVSVAVVEDKVPLKYSGPRERAALWSDQSFVLTVGVKNQSSRVMRTRPLFKNWRAEFTVEIEEDASVNPADVERAIATAGRKVGIGDWRPGAPHGGRYGRFVLESFTEV